MAENPSLMTPEERMVAVQAALAARRVRIAALFSRPPPGSAAADGQTPAARGAGLSTLIWALLAGALVVLPPVRRIVALLLAAIPLFGRARAIVRLARRALAPRERTQRQPHRQPTHSPRTH
jgi:hypothetical protein